MIVCNAVLECHDLAPLNIRQFRVFSRSLGVKFSFRRMILHSCMISNSHTSMHMSSMILTIYLFVFIRLVLSSDHSCSIDNGIRHSNYQKALVKYLAMPFEDLIRAKTHERKTKAYMTAFSQRPEFDGIDWHVEDCIELAKQLWKFQLPNVEKTYHKQLCTKLQLAMELNGVSEARAEMVKQITSDWIRTRNRMRGKKVAKSREQTEEARASTFAKKRQVYHENLIERTQGRSKPLLSYMKLEHPEKATREELLEEALKYKSMYRCLRSYIRHLRQMWRALHYKDEDVILQNRDPRNYSCEQWEQPTLKVGCDSTDLDEVAKGQRQAALHILESNSDSKSNDCDALESDEHLPYAIDPSFEYWNDISFDTDIDGFSDLDLAQFDLQYPSQEEIMAAD